MITLKSALGGAIAVVLLVACPAPGKAAGTEVDVSQLVAELRQIIDQGGRRADPRFLDELRRFADTYDRPWSRTVLEDGFQDGDYTSAPAWNVVTGSFRVDQRYGLVASPEAPPSRSGARSSDLASALIGQLLQQQQGGARTAARPNTSALIATLAPTANAFAVEMELSGLGDGATFEVMLAQGTSGATGYALVLETGAAPGLSLQRVGSRGRAVVGRHEGLLRPGTAGTIPLEWTRGRDGQMRVRHDGEVLLETVDRGLRDGFAHLLVSAQGAEVGIRRIAVASLP